MKVKIVANQLIVTSDISKDDFVLAERSKLTKIIDNETRDEIYAVMFKEGKSGSLSESAIVFNTYTDDHKLQCVVALAGTNAESRKAEAEKYYADALLKAAQAEKDINTKVVAKRDLYNALFSEMEVSN